MSEILKELENQANKELAKKMDNYILDCILKVEKEKPNLATIKKNAEIVTNNFGYRSVYWKGKRVGGFSPVETSEINTVKGSFVKFHFMFETVAL